MFAACGGSPWLPCLRSHVARRKGTTTSDVTVWIDPSSHRILKSHMTSQTTANLSFDLAAASKLPAMIGPMSIKGGATVDRTPA